MECTISVIGNNFGQSLSLAWGQYYICEPYVLKAFFFFCYHTVSVHCSTIKSNRAFHRGTQTHCLCWSEQPNPLIFPVGFRTIQNKKTRYKPNLLYCTNRQGSHRADNRPRIDSSASSESNTITSCTACKRGSDLFSGRMLAGDWKLSEAASIATSVNLCPTACCFAFLSTDWTFSSVKIKAALSSHPLILNHLSHGMTLQHTQVYNLVVQGRLAAAFTFPRLNLKYTHTNTKSL